MLQDKQIIDEGTFLFIVFQLLEEEMVKLEYNHFRTFNELMDLGNDESVVADISERKTTRLCMLPDGGTLKGASPKLI